MMKWDVKHDRAKKVIDAFLDNAGYWQEREDLSEGLSEEEKELVNEEVNLMITSIRKRYKLDVRLPQQTVQIQSKEGETEIPTAEAKKLKPEPVSNVEMEDKPKRTRKSATGEKKVPVRKTRSKKKEAEKTHRYYSTQRPFGPGTFPQKDGRETVVNFDGKTYCEEIGKEAWGYIDYPEPLTKEEADSYELVESEGR